MMTEYVSSSLHLARESMAYVQVWKSEYLFFSRSVAKLSVDANHISYPDVVFSLEEAGEEWNFELRTQDV